jgi:hypothetical protein
MTIYEERKQRKIEMFKRIAEKKRKEAEALYNQAESMASVIPFGQPILVGHYSEKRDRNYRDRIHNKFGKAFETFDKAKYYEQRAERAENNKAISSNDPEAMRKLEEKIKELETYRETLHSIQKELKAKSIDEVNCDDEIKHYVRFGGSNKIPQFVFSNLSQNIKRHKDRLEYLKQQSTRVEQEHLINDIKILENTEDNRVQIFFPAKPSQEIISQLKRYGFRWSPYNKAWQRQLNDYSVQLAKEIVNKMEDR